MLPAVRFHEKGYYDGEGIGHVYVYYLEQSILEKQREMGWGIGGGVHLWGGVGLQTPPGTHQRSHERLERLPVGLEHAQQRGACSLPGLTREPNVTTNQSTNGTGTAVMLPGPGTRVLSTLV